LPACGPADYNVINRVRGTFASLRRAPAVECASFTAGGGKAVSRAADVHRLFNLPRFRPRFFSVFDDEVSSQRGQPE